MQEKRQGGQTQAGWNAEPNRDAFSIIIQNRRYHFQQQMEKEIGLNENSMLQWNVTANRHEINSHYGLNVYDGIQHHVSSRIRMHHLFAKPQHAFDYGISHTTDDFDESLNQTEIDRIDHITGLFTEYSFSHLKHFNLVAGMRVDHHQKHGFWYSPRLHIRYQFIDLTTLRLSAGRGYRMPNQIVENTPFLVSSRTFVLAEQVQPESSWNSGISLTRPFIIKGKDLSIHADYFFTWFDRQLIVDADLDPQKLFFYALDGSSFSHSFQTELTVNPVKGLELRFAYRWNLVKTTYHGKLLDRLMVPRHRGLIHVAYETPNGKWNFNVTANLNGQARLQHVQPITDGRKLPEFSPFFVTLNTQITWKADKLELYWGIENLNNYRQNLPVIGFDDPFGNNFDASMVYGPVIGTIAYMGIRWWK
jgi:outer membrane receptor protein involved in Fe transport